jgi:hypothetical protein
VRVGKPPLRPARQAHRQGRARPLRPDRRARRDRPRRPARRPALRARPRPLRRPGEAKEGAPGSVSGPTPANRADARRSPAEPRFDFLCASTSLGEGDVMEAKVTWERMATILRHHPRSPARRLLRHHPRSPARRPAGRASRTHAPKSRMPPSGTSGSVGAPGGNPRGDPIFIASQTLMGARMRENRRPGTPCRMRAASILLRVPRLWEARCLRCDS